MEIVPPATQKSLTIQDTTAASFLIRLAQPQNHSLHRALEKAQDRLISQPWRVDSGVLYIVSFSHQNDVHLTDGEDCSCLTTRGVCWHRAAWSILSTLSAAGCSLVANLPLPNVIDESELPGSFLDGPFDSFDDVELTAPVKTPVKTPAFIEGDAVTAPPFRLQPSREIPNPLDAEMDFLFEPVRANRVREVA